MKKITVILMVLIFLSSFAASTGEYKMVGGYGIDDLIYLGNTEDQIEEYWGEPTATIPLEVFLGSYGKDGAAYFYAPYGITLLFDGKGKLVYIAVASGDYVTAEGIKVGDGENKVISTYGSDYFKERAFDPKNDYRLRYEKSGYEFSIRDGKVIGIGVFYKK